MIQKVFIPGSQWLYFKLYTGRKTGDGLLTDYLYPLTNALLGQGLISKMFFIRYSDPDYHIRYRLLIDDVANYSKVMDLLYRYINPCIQNKLISKVMCDTYVREISRYGSITIESAEMVFFDDSMAVMEILSRLNNSEKDKEQERWQLSLRLIDDYCSAFGYGLEEKFKLMTNLSAAYKMEHGLINKHYTKQLNDQYRMHGSLVYDAFKSDILDDYNGILVNRRNKIAEILQLDGKTIKTNSDMLSSLLHMTIIRFFRSRNRTYEMVLYHYLEKYYMSEKARSPQLLTIKTNTRL